ncbi:MULTISPECIES: MFS transporter [unclassified Curtobacterium]|uniref:MFS transporter n=1 Tax=unclassified Curtobacterium TaxID=257496 RepID=UPI0021ABCD35|nr:MULTISPECIES: MFS transporter [unclassified Curtobacterium]WIE79201.1 MFS transporter [Curtobacterium sp. MCSS17_016]
MARQRRFHWLPWVAVVAAGGVLSVMSAPGQTAGLSVFTDPLIRELGVSRTKVSGSYLVGTLIGACVLPLTGRALDRWGVRRMTMLIGVAFAVFLVALSLISEVVGLTAGSVGVRMAGQGALSLAATTVVARTVRNRRGLALGIASGIGSGGISLVPVFVESLIATSNIHTAWRVEAIAVAVVVIPVAFFLPRHQEPGSQTAQSGADVGQQLWTLREAASTGMFWVIAAGLAASGMLSTALAFHQVAVLGEQGLTATEAAANFLPQTVTGIAATLITGALSDRIAPKCGVTIAMVTLTGALVLLPTVQPGWTAIVYGLVLGAAGGSLRGIEAAAYVRYYGTANIGVIRGVATGVNLASTAFGPLLLALGHDIAGNYTAPVLCFAVLPATVAMVSVFARPPKHPSLVQ